MKKVIEKKEKMDKMIKAKDYYTEEGVHYCNYCDQGTVYEFNMKVHIQRCESKRHDYRVHLKSTYGFVCTLLRQHLQLWHRSDAPQTKSR